MSLCADKPPSFTIQSLMATDLPMVPPEMTVAQAVAQIEVASGQGTDSALGQLGCAIVVEPHRYIGLLTERCILRSIAQGHSFETITVGQAIGSPPVSLFEQDLNDYAALTAHLQNHLDPYIPVVNAQGQPLGIIAREGLRAALRILTAPGIIKPAPSEAIPSKRQDCSVAAVTEPVRPFLDIQQVLDDAVAGARSQLGCSRTIIYQLRPDYSGTVIAEALEAGHRSFLGHEVHDPCISSDWIEPYRKGTIRVVEDVHKAATSLCHQEMLLNFDLRAKLMVPITIQGELWGLLIASHRDAPYSWSLNEIEILRQLSRQVALALQQATIHQQLQRELQSRQQAEALLLESEQRFSSLMAIAPVGIFRTDARGHCTYTNDRYCYLAGRPADALMGSGWRQVIHPEEREQVVAAWEAWALSVPALPAVPETQIFDLSCRFQRPDGSTVWVYVQAIAERNNSGDVVGYVGTLTDITAQKQAETALRQSELTNRTIINSIPDLLIQMDRQGRCSSMVGGRSTPMPCSDASASEFRVGDRLPSKLAQRCLQHVEQALTHRTLQVYEQVIDSAEDLRYEEVRVAPLNGDAALVMVRDITERKQAELQLQRLLVATAATIGQDFFPALVSHIAKTLDVSHVLVTERVGHELRVLAGFIGGELQDSFSYDLAKTPCERVLEHGMFYCERAVQQAFPEDLDLVDMAAEGYMGVALCGPAGEAIGHLCIISAQPFKEAERAGQILRVFAARAAAELGRQRANGRLEQLNQQLEAKIEERTAELLEREQFLQTVLDTFPLSVFWKDQNSVYLGCNRRFLKDAGFSSADAVVGKTDFDMPWDTHEAEAYRADDSQVVASERPKLGIIETQVQADGSQVWLETNKLPLYDLTGAVIGVLGTYQDITDRKQAEQALFDSRQLLQTILDTLPIPVNWKDRNSVYLGCNQQLAAILGFDSPAEIVGKTDFDIVIDHDEAVHFRTDDNEVMTSGEPKLEIEEPLTVPGGDQRWLITNKAPLRDSTGDVFGVVVTIQDITDRKQAELSLRESEQRFRRAIADAPSPIMIHAEDGEVLQLSTTWTELTGYTHADIPTTVAWAQLAYGDRAQAMIAESINRKYNLTRRWDEGESIISTRSGSRRIWHFTAAPLGALPDGRRLVISMAADITQRKQAEAQVRALLNRTQLLGRINAEIRDSLDLEIIIFNLVHAVVAELPVDTCNFAWYTGATAASPAQLEVVREKKVVKQPSCLGSYDANTFPQLLNSIRDNHIYRVDDVRAASDCSLAVHLGKIGIATYLSIPIHTVGGRIGSLQMSRATVQPWEDGEIELFQNVGNQVAIAIHQADLYKESRAKTEQLQRSYEELEAAQRQLIQSEKMSSLGQLVAGIAHEINNPVGFIYGNMAIASDYVSNLTTLIKLYQEHYPDPPQAIAELAERVDTEYILGDFPKLLASMENGANRIQHIVQSLRTFSRLEQTDSSAVDLQTHIDATLVLLQNRLNGRAGNPKIQVSKQYGDALRVECYSSLLDQVFMNLLANAIDAIEERQQNETDYTGHLTVTTAVAPSGRFRIGIRDNGMGMTPATQVKIFNPFFTTKPIGEGTGMGLAISYQIVTGSHKGTLQCKSSLGAGTEFIIELPPQLPQDDTPRSP